MTRENQISLDQDSLRKRPSGLRLRKPYPKLPVKAEVGAHLQKTARFEYDRNDLHSFLSRGTPAQYSGRKVQHQQPYSSYTRAQSIINGQRVSDFSQVPANRKPTSDWTLPSHNNNNLARYQFYSVSSFSRTSPSLHLQLGTDHY